MTADETQKRRDKVDEIRQEIQQIRDEMDHTLEAIQERISPQHLMDQAREAVREVTHGAAADVAQNARDAAANAGSAALNVIREHPIPVAMAGLGVSWLLTHRPNPAHVSQNVTETRDQIGGAVGDAVTRAQDAAQQIGSQAATRANRAGGLLQQAIHDNPLAVGAAALALGAVVALAVPQTPQEHQVMGPARDRLVANAQDAAQSIAQKAQTAAQETAQKVQHVAQEARDAAQRTAQQEGLL
jgi:ElaB/YqjD/DUF883 family membrane-anchored ribosome-binding protein